MAMVSLVMMLALFSKTSTVSADLATDRKECTDQLMTLATCLNYVSGTAKMPTPDCCGGLKQVLSKSPKCLCILIKDHDDPSLGLKIDPELAMNLPASCHNAPANISQCASTNHLLFIFLVAYLHAFFQLNKDFHDVYEKSETWVLVKTVQRFSN